MESFWSRGGAWVLAQSVLMPLILVAGWVQDGVPPGWAILPGWLLVGWGAAAGLAGAAVLGRNRTIFPLPNPDSTLVRQGIYRWIRHPLYSSLMGLAFGWSLLRWSWPALVCSGLLTVLLRFKAAREERWLAERFPEHEHYSRRVARFIPCLW